MPSIHLLLLLQPFFSPFYRSPGRSFVGETDPPLKPPTLEDARAQSSSLSTSSEHSWCFCHFPRWPGFFSGFFFAFSDGSWIFHDFSGFWKTAPVKLLRPILTSHPLYLFSDFPKPDEDQEVGGLTPGGEHHIKSKDFEKVSSRKPPGTKAFLSLIDAKKGLNDHPICTPTNFKSSSPTALQSSTAPNLLPSSVS